AGAVPYVDVWDTKPPGIFALMAVVAPAAGGSMLGLAVMEALWLATAALFLNALLELLGVHPLWRGTALVSLLLLNALGKYAEGGGLAELFLLGPGLAAVYCWLRN